jgi:hypothetical protein
MCVGLILTLVISIPAIAQNTPKPVATPFGPQAVPPPNPEQQPAIPPVPPAFYPDSPTKVFAIRYVDVRSIETLVRTFGVPISRESNLNAIAVKAPEKTLAAIEEMIKRFDVPANVSKRVELTAYLVLGSPLLETEAIPAALKPVVEQLRNIMAYKSYRVLDTILGVGKEGDNIQVTAIIPKLNEAEPGGSPQYSFAAVPRVTGEAAEQVIHFENLRLDLGGLSGGRSVDIHTTVDVKKGQQIVVGKATVQDRAVILVLSAKILD